MVDYRFFRDPALSGITSFYGTLAAHELGHSFGLLHPHAGVNYASNLFVDTCFLGGDTGNCVVPANDLVRALSPTASSPTPSFTPSHTLKRPLFFGGGGSRMGAGQPEPRRFFAGHQPVPKHVWSGQRLGIAVL